MGALTQLTHMGALTQLTHMGQLMRFWHCVIFLSKTLYPLLSYGSTQEDTSRHDLGLIELKKNEILARITKFNPSFKHAYG